MNDDDGQTGDQGEGREKTTGPLVGVARAIEDGVARVGEKAPEVVSVVYHRVKKGIAVAYGTGSTIVRDAYHAAGDYADRYRHKVEIGRLNERRDALTARLGSLVYTRVVIDAAAPAGLAEDAEVADLFLQIQRLDEEIVAVGKELEKD